jgi:uncharacterized RDD family membrane protein YckC
VETLSIQTAQNVAIGLRIAGVGARIGAYLIDWLIVTALFLLFIFFDVADHIPDFALPYVKIAIFLLFVLYAPTTEFLWNGQTIGKRVVGIRVVKRDGTAPRFFDYMIRGIVGVFETSMTMGALSTSAVAVTKRSQRIGDMLADTVVVKVFPPVTLMQLLRAIDEAEERYGSSVTFPQASRLSDKDIDIIRRVLLLTQGSKYSNERTVTLLYDMARRIETVLGLSNVQTDATTFLSTLLRDHQTLHGAVTTIDSAHRR